MERAKFLFDLRGYIVLRQVLSETEVKLANEAINRHEFHEREGSVRLATKESKFSGEGGRYDMAGMLGWKNGDNEIFRKLLVHPKLVPYLHLLVGKGYRLDHFPLILAQNKGTEGFGLHGGPITSSGNFIPQLQYVCKNNEIYNSLLAVSFQLTDHNKDDGGFCVVPGSHKINFPPLHELMQGEDQELNNECIVQPCTKAGDVILFSEATIHGCLPWKADYQRRVALYRFSPSHLAFARGYSDSWPSEFLDGMTDEQLTVMQPPYHPMYDRPCLNSDGSLGQPRTRSEEKKNFDKLVFGRDYY